MTRSLGLALALALPALLLASPAGAADRLERFRALAAARLTAVDDGERAHELLRQLYALLDEEIVESLASGSVFSSLAFMQDRLDGFAEAWGGASLRVSRLGRLTVGAFQLGDGPDAASVRIYGTVAGEAQLVRTFHRDGRPSVHALPPAAGAAQALLVWEGWPSASGARPLQVELLRETGEDARVVWSTHDLHPEGLWGRRWRVRNGEVRIRYELRYPGWVPGCEQQTEQEDVYQLAPDGAGFMRVSRRQFNPWHQALHRAVARLFEALAAGDQRTLAALVPDGRLRERLPASLLPEPACDAPDAPVPAAVSVAATAGGAPWALTWQRTGDRWRLVGAGPVLE